MKIQEVLQHTRNAAAMVQRIITETSGAAKREPKEKAHKYLYQALDLIEKAAQEIAKF